MNLGGRRSMKYSSSQLPSFCTLFSKVDTTRKDKTMTFSQLRLYTASIDTNRVEIVCCTRKEANDAVLARRFQLERTMSLPYAIRPIALNISDKSKRSYYIL